MISSEKFPLHLFIPIQTKLMTNFDFQVRQSRKAPEQECLLSSSYGCRMAGACWGPVFFFRFNISDFSTDSIPWKGNSGSLCNHQSPSKCEDFIYVSKKLYSSKLTRFSANSKTQKSIWLLENFSPISFKNSIIHNNINLKFRNCDEVYDRHNDHPSSLPHIVSHHPF